MSGSMKQISAVFYSTRSGTEPVRDWLLSLSPDDRNRIGRDIMAVEFGWPIGMPLCRSLTRGLWEVRSNLSGHRIARVIFSIEHGEMYLLNGFIKKSQKTPKNEIETALDRRRDLDS